MREAWGATPAVSVVIRNLTEVNINKNFTYRHEKSVWKIPTFFDVISYCREMSRNAFLSEPTKYCIALPTAREHLSGAISKLGRFSNTATGNFHLSAFSQWVRQLDKFHTILECFEKVCPIIRSKCGKTQFLSRTENC